MILSVRVLVAIPTVLLVSLAGCASPKTPPPVDPTREQIIILQKQLLELQNAQIETRKKVDEQAVIISNLSGRIKSAEDRNAVVSVPPQSDQKKTANTHTAPKKKPAKGQAKKKKPVRRQEQ